jgi:DNA-binding transcriptional MocR family regulator
VDSPYESAKAILLDVVATANQCRAVWHKDLGLSTVFGFPCDLDAVELIFASLQVQAATAMVHADDDRGTDASRTRSFRQSFLASYAERTGEGLDEAAGAARRQAALGRGGPSISPVLAARRRVVDEALSRMFPELTQHHAA